jgi:hypothetical protein
VLYYLIDGDPEQISLREFLAAGDPDAARWALPTDPLFADQPYALDRSRVPAEHPLLVIFDGADCPRCPRFHAEVLGDAAGSKATSACAVSVQVICGWRNRYRVPRYAGYLKLKVLTAKIRLFIDFLVEELGDTTDGGGQ